MTVNHGDIRPYNVIVTPEGNVKLGEVFLHSQPLSSYSQLLNNSLEELYISPQLFRSLKDFKFIPVYDANKSDLYSIGMTILEAATLEDVTLECYNKETYAINADQVNRLLNNVRVQHSYTLYAFLEKLLIEDEIQRPSIEELVIELNQPAIQSQKTGFLLTVENAQLQNVGNQAITYVQEEKAVRSANHGRESFTQEKIQFNPANYISTITQQSPVIETVNYQNDDLNARIQAALVMSRETIAKYGSPNTAYSTTPATYATTSYTTSLDPPLTQNTNVLLETEASQVQTRTFLNQKTNNIETQNYNVEKPVEKTVKKSLKQELTVSQNNQSVEPINQYVVSFKDNLSQNYSDLNNQFTVPAQNSFSSNQPEDNIFTTSSYAPYQQQSQSSQAPASSGTQQAETSYQTSTINFQNSKEREAYIQKIINEAKQYALNFENINNTIANTYVDNKPQENNTNSNTLQTQQQVTFQQKIQTQ